MRRILYVSVVLSFILLLNSCDSSLNSYKPKNEEERQIISLLITFSDACNKGDLTKIKSVFHENGVYNGVRGGQVTKSQITETDPKWWTLAGKIQIKNPEFKINEEEAEVLVKVKHGAHFSKYSVFNLKKSGDQWLIMEVE